MGDDDFLFDRGGESSAPTDELHRRNSLFTFVPEKVREQLTRGLGASAADSGKFVSLARLVTSLFMW